MTVFANIKRLGAFLTATSFRRNYVTKRDQVLKSLSSIYATEKDVAQMKSVHEEVVGYLTGPHHLQQIAEIRELYKNMIEYNVGQYISGYAVIDMYKALANEEDLTCENIKLANVLGWCYEALAGAALILDDTMDGSTTRRGKLAWHKRNDVGLQAINHAFLLENTIYVVLSRYFRDTAICSSLMEIVHDLLFTTFVGQIMDNSFVKYGKPRLELYTSEQFRQLSYLKIGYVSISSSLVFAACLAQKLTKEFEANANSIAMKFAPVVQANNDFVGCFDNRRKAAKGDSDVSEGKCTWMVVKALEKANLAQKQTIEKYYGRPGAEAEMAIRSLYEELELRKDYKNYERETLKECFDYVKRLPNKERSDAFFKVLSKIPVFFKFLDKYSDEEHGNARAMKIFV